MEALRIDKFEARYRLPRAYAGARERLDGLLQEVLEEAFELALENAGISPREEICLRKVHVPVRLRLAASDRTLIERWSEVLAEYIHHAIESGNSSSVVRYSSRFNGMVDFAAGVALKNYSRAWAWNQLGLTQLLEEATAAEAAAQFINVMVAEGRSVVPVLKAMAEINQLHRLAGRIGREGWGHLAAAALAAVGVEPAEILGIEAVVSRIAGDSAAPETARVLALSSIAKAAIKFRNDFAEPSVPRSSLAALVALEAEPDLLRRSGEVVLLRMRALNAELKTCLDGKRRSSIARALERTDNLSERQREHSRHDSLRGPNQSDRFNASTQSAVNGISPPGEQQTIRLDEQVPNERNTCPTDEESPGFADYLEAGYPPPETQQIGQTAYGGLLFLLPLIGALGLPDELPRGLGFKQRSLRWILYRLALHLTACGETDPAALAFCGLAPETELPWREEPRADADEREALGNAAGRIVAELRERLGWDHREADRLIDFVCRRRARIDADPGWLEVVLALEEVSTDIRRAALDLDPGYLPWLGVVVKFRYE